MIYEIYLITNKINNKKYIGQTVSRLSSGRKYGSSQRFNKHMNDALNNNINRKNIFCNAIRKHGRDKFNFEILIYCNKSDVDFYECKFITFYNTLLPNGYNTDPGGKTNKNQSQFIKERLSKISRFLHISDENKILLNEALQNVKLTELPYGINFTSCQDDDVIGFIVKKKDNTTKSFISKTETLNSKLQLALKYYSYIQDENEEKLNEMDEQFDIDVKKRIRDTKITQEFKNIMKNINLDINDLPLHIGYIKRTNSFVVYGKNVNKYFRKDTAEEALKDAIKYVNNL